jgi:hypothetical protein
LQQQQKKYCSSSGSDVRHFAPSRQQEEGLGMDENKPNPKGIFF